MKQEYKITAIYGVLTLVATLILPWTIIVGVAFLFGYFLKANKFKTFTLSLVIPFTIWIAIAFIRNSGYIKSISKLVSDLLGDLGESTVYLITGLSIGLVCGFSALTGQALASLIYHNKTLEK